MTRVRAPGPRAVLIAAALLTVTVTRTAPAQEITLPDLSTPQARQRAVEESLAWLQDVFTRARDGEVYLVSAPDPLLFLVVDRRRMDALIEIRLAEGEIDAAGAGALRQELAREAPQALATAVRSYGKLAAAPEAGVLTTGWGDRPTTQYRGQAGRRLTFECPPNGDLSTIWGTDVYTDDSAVCSAAVHAGLLTTAAGGRVTVEIRPGQDHYAGSTRNGVTSLDYAAWQGSYVFVGAPTTTPPAAPTPGPATAGTEPIRFTGGGWTGWLEMRQADCVERAQGAIESQGLTVTAVEAWYAHFEGRGFVGGIACVADDGTRNLISTTATRLLVMVGVERAAGNTGELRDALADYMRAGATPLEPPNRNVALGRPARQSSRSRWSRDDDPQGAVDGEITGSYGFHTADEPNPWWMVDLGRNYPLRQIRVFNRIDCCAERARTLGIYVSSDGRNWELVYQNPGTVFGGKDGNPLVVDLRGHSGRYVKLQLNETNYLHLDEVEIDHDLP